MLVHKFCLFMDGLGAGSWKWWQTAVPAARNCPGIGTPPKIEHSGDQTPPPKVCLLLCLNLCPLLVVDVGHSVEVGDAVDEGHLASPKWDPPRDPLYVLHHHGMYHQTLSKRGVLPRGNVCVCPGPNG